MFIREKPNKSGLISIQIIDKSTGRYRVVQTVGSSKDPAKIKALKEEARCQMAALQGQTSLNFEINKEQELIDLIFSGLQQIELVGPELILGKLFDEIPLGPGSKMKSLLFKSRY